jgi:hypothetical protein
MLHPALARALAVVHSEDLQRTAAHRRTVRTGRHVVHEAQMAEPSKTHDGGPRRLDHLDAARPRATA